jgi:pimeloyl-ACP methyl ester carboxylesterase
MTDLAPTFVRGATIVAALVRIIAHAAPFCATAGADEPVFHLNQKHVFPVAFKPVDPAALRSLSDETHALRQLAIQDSGIEISAYADRCDSAKGYLIFFNGSGYGAEPALKRLLTPVRALDLNLVAFNYYDSGQPAPSVTQMRSVAQALYRTVAALPDAAAQSIYVGGHSLGASFALDVAGQKPVKGVLLVGPSTDPIEQNVRDFRPLRVRIIPDDEVKQLNNIELAKAVTAKTILFGSQGDKDTPPAFTSKMLAALPGTAKRLVIFDDVKHSDYFLQAKLWHETAAFFGLTTPKGEPPRTVR